MKRASAVIGVTALLMGLGSSVANAWTGTLAGCGVSASESYDTTSSVSTTSGCNSQARVS